MNINQQIKTVQREIAMRKRVYPRWVSQGKMTKAKAEHEIKAMEAVHQTLVDLASEKSFELEGE